MLGVLLAARHLSSGRSGARGDSIPVPRYGNAAILQSILSAGGAGIATQALPALVCE
jgi:hypothetical protein